MATPSNRSNSGDRDLLSEDEVWDGSSLRSEDEPGLQALGTQDT